ncbi:hypothetical protein FRC04_011852 [Tulasnella sp. 424]|nr:hypothetical protein FRC04_011852 [Tulasnella sp. 424]
MADSNTSSKPNARKSDAVAGSSKEGNAGKRRKVNHACLYCRRSHMHCDENRPCARCIKRDIGHLCHDEVKPPPLKQPSVEPSNPPTASIPNISLPTSAGPQIQTFANVGQTFTPIPGTVAAMKVDSVGGYAPGAGSTPFVAAGAPMGTSPVGMSSWPLVSDPASFFNAETAAGANGEFSVLSQFLDNLDANPWFNNPSITNPSTSLLASASTSTPGTQQPQVTGSSSAMSASPLQFTLTGGGASESGLSQAQSPLKSGSQPQISLPQALSPETERLTASASQLLLDQQQKQPKPQEQTHHEHEHVDPLPPSTKTERFLITAADQEDGTREERLKAVIRAKYEAALLKPYNYVKGYARLSRWMERNVSPESRQAILQPISVLRPKFRSIAQSLKDIDLVYVEEAFERLLLDYDRVFSAMGIPACLWRRTGEIYKANKGFADLVGIDVSKLRDGRLCIYELMSENSAVNYWEKYGHVAFDAQQKAVLTSCVLRYKPNLPALQSGSQTASGTAAQKAALKRRQLNGDSTADGEETFINCCFSFTIRRDIWGIPSMIVGNFIKC